MGAAMRFVTSALAPEAHMIGTSPKNAQATVIIQAHPFDGAVQDGVFEIFAAPYRSGSLSLVVGEVELEEHEDPPTLPVHRS